MIIKVKTTTETEREINFPYFTQSEHGTIYGHFSEKKCVVVASDLKQVILLESANGLEYAECSQHLFEKKFNDAMSLFLNITENI